MYGALPPEPEPTHVVGQQGRRGVLPSAPGKSQPGPTKTVPQKDSEGKYPCPHCNKSYQHAKHLKRHLLRHTGDRPYQCKLCKDTFSRSDILKRHFQKCSIRRGVPPDTDHLEGSRAHVNRHRSAAGPSDQNYPTSSNPPPPPQFHENSSSSSAVAGMPSYLPQDNMYPGGLPPISTRSRAGSLRRPDGMSDHRRSIPNLDQLPSSRTSFDESPGYATPSSIPPNYHQQLAAFAVPPSQTSGQYPQSFGYATSGNLAEYGQDQQHIKAEDHGTLMYDRDGTSSMQSTQEQALAWFPPNSSEDPQHAFFAGVYTHAANFNDTQTMESWDVGITPTDSKAAALISFCFVDGAPKTPAEFATEARLKSILTGEHIRQFVLFYRNWDRHFPSIHIPTFDFLTAYDGLVLSIACIGAVYSGKMGVHDVRWLMELVGSAVQRATQYDTVNSGVPVNRSLEEVQALILLQILFTWHGNQAQRQRAREEYWKIASVARQAGLLAPLPPGHPAYSMLHQPGPNPSPHEYNNWNWEIWVEQEKRQRVCYLIYTLDCAMAIFWNAQPYIDVNEMKICLPSDDAAWEARTASECAAALGLHGPHAQMTNVNGDRRLKQPDLRTAMKVMMEPSGGFNPGASNVYGKFILIHALHVQIWTAQRHALSGMVSYQSIGSSGPSTPVSHNDWVAADGSSTTTTTNTTGTGAGGSGHVTPVEGNQNPHQQYPQAHHQMLKSIRDALAKWKRAWDIDLDEQYPPSHPTRRDGFCRDPIHFYHLAQQYLQNTRALDWKVDADTRFTGVMFLLKWIKKKVASDSEGRGREIGSIGVADDSYGVEDLTLDMKLLFVPINE
ncbi:hypothetical protein K402DRAFT_339747 [Aulographum hederae CBS 113979]|uniref:C2H2-type domain-containing protein n=1 Tax=Aulographum hederae CBS 113979 TaxID=1176131 RepID=A0A6G1GPR6_9PEZI|nr:hypothetical protein K402DRAFT_339747 [Aulographum hederae CBS 113979]